jgi:c-di-GMP-binding flagellar brake protein YcgR
VETVVISGNTAKAKRRIRDNMRQLSYDLFSAGGCALRCARMIKSRTCSKYELEDAIEDDGSFVWAEWIWDLSEIERDEFVRFFNKRADEFLASSSFIAAKLRINNEF